MNLKKTESIILDCTTTKRIKKKSYNNLYYINVRGVIMLLFHICIILYRMLVGRSVGRSVCRSKRVSVLFFFFIFNDRRAVFLE